MDLKNAHPIVSFFYFVLTGCIMMTAKDPIICMISLVSVCIFSFSLRGMKTGISDIMFYFPMLIMVSLVNPLISHNGATPLFFLNGNPVTLEAVLYGVMMGISVISVLYLCVCFSEIVTEDKILYLLGNITPKFALMISMTMHFVPLFKERYRNTKNAQKTLGCFSSESRFDRLKTAFTVFSAVISQSIERSVETSASMKARGYGIGKRSCFSRFKYTRSDAALTVCVLTLSVFVITTQILGILNFDFYPRITSIEFSHIRIVVYIAYAVLMLIPFILKIKEDLKWKYLISKI